MRRSLSRLLLPCLAAALWAAGCSSPPPEAVDVPVPTRDVHPLLRGTVGAAARLDGAEATLVSGYGVVVGLNGTGGGPYPVDVYESMIREVARNMIGRGSPLPGGPLRDVTPAEFLRSDQVAIVIVEGAIAPGAPEGTQFDVRVRALPGSSVTSLEGGKLWTTPLRFGPPTVYTAPQARVLGEAAGPIFINPFSEPGSGGDRQVMRTVGRVLAGGTVTEPLRLALMLETPSHTRARSIVAAINSRFPPGAGDRGPTAVGQDASVIALRIPRAYADRPAEFLRLVEFTQIDQTFPQEYAKRYAERLPEETGMAVEIGWCLTAIGRAAVPFVEPLYESGELSVRLTALRVGAKLGDPRTAPYLKELAQSGPPGIRAEAITLLAGLPSNPAINKSLRELASSPLLEVRVSAYEALIERDDVTIDRIVPDNRFALDVVPVESDPLIYVTQQGEPRIVLFGRSVRVNRPSLLSAWSNRLMLVADASPRAQPRIMYRDWKTGSATQAEVPDDLVSLIEYMAHTQSPEQPDPGLGMSYSEVVGALYEMHRQGVIDVKFATEEDRLKASILSASRETRLVDRPLDSTEPIRDIFLLEPENMAEDAGPAGAGERPSLVEPIEPVLPTPSRSRDE